MAGVRLRFVHKLSLLLMGAVLISVLAMASVLAFNLSEGFTEYLAARDREWLGQFSEFAEGFIEEQDAAGISSWKRGGLKQLMDGYAQELGLVDAVPKPPRPRPVQAEIEILAGIGNLEARQPPLQPHGEMALRGRKGKPHRAGHFVFRLVVVDADGQLLFSNRTRLGESAEFIEEPVTVNGEVVARARLYAAPDVPDDVEARFLRQQYSGIAIVSFVLIVLALVSSWFMARHWVRPLYAIQEATSRLAKGNFDVRVPMASHGRSRNDEIGDLIGDINRMAEGLGRLERSRRRWLADISHELRTPLAVLRGEIEALIDGVRPITMPSIVSLREEALRLGSLVDDLHLLALSDLKALPCEFTDIDAVSVLNDLVKRFASRAASDNLSLTFEQSESAGVPVCWDRIRMQQLLDNLVENSLRYTEAPGRIVISLQQENGIIRIRIDDTAPAPAKAALAHLFEPLYRANGTSTNARQGSGLGLAISEAIARSHDGKLEAGLSSLGGLQVSVSLPQVVSDSKRS